MALTQKIDDTIGISKPFVCRRKGDGIAEYLSNLENKVECFIADKINRLGRKGFDIVEIAKAVTYLGTHIIYCRCERMNDQREGRLIKMFKFP